MEREVIKEPTFLFKTIRGHCLGNVVFLIIHKEVVHIVYLAKNLYTPVINELQHNSLREYTAALNKKKYILGVVS